MGRPLAFGFFRHSSILHVVAEPALSGSITVLSDLVSKCAPIAVITVLWSILYMNMKTVLTGSKVLWLALSSSLQPKRCHGAGSLIGPAIL